MERLWGASLSSVFLPDWVSCACASYSFPFPFLRSRPDLSTLTSNPGIISVLVMLPLTTPPGSLIHHYFSSHPKHHKGKNTPVSSIFLTPYYLSGDSVRAYRLRVKSHRTASFFQTSDANGKFQVVTCISDQATINQGSLDPSLLGFDNLLEWLLELRETLTYI